MKAIFKLTIALALLIFLKTNDILANELLKVKVCWEDGLKPPYLMLKDGKHSETDSMNGIAVDTIEIILKKNRISIKNILMPWKRCLTEIQKGSVDIVPNASINPERQEFAYFTEKPLYTTNMVLFYAKKHFKKKPKINNIDDLKKYIVGGYLGFNYKYFNNQIELDTGSTSRELLFQKLRSGRFDFAIEQLEVVNYIASQGIISLNGLDYIPNNIMPKQNYYIMISKKSDNAEKIKNILDEGIIKSISNNLEKKLIKKYNSINKKNN